MAHHHDHQHVNTNTSERALWWALALSISVLVVELIGGYITGSLALISDAAHVFTDSTALMIALIAVRLANKKPDLKRSFGYYRFEILAAAVNALLLFTVAIYITYEAFQRLHTPQTIQSGTMLFIAVVGLFANALAVYLLAPQKEHNLNMKGAYLEVWSDMLSSLAVIGAAIVIRFTDWYWFDTLAAFGISVWVLPRTWVLFRETINVLLEGVPDGLSLLQIKTRLQEVEGVASVYDLHVWSISTDKIILTAHLVALEHADLLQTRQRAQCMLQEQYGIAHTTLQMERANETEQALDCRLSHTISHKDNLKTSSVGQYPNAK